MKLMPGDRIILETNLLKKNSYIIIHPDSRDIFPEQLSKGSVGEVVDIDHKSDRPFFVKFMIRNRSAWEQPFMRDNVVYVSLPTSFAGYIKKHAWT